MNRPDTWWGKKKTIQSASYCAIKQFTQTASDAKN